MLTKKCNRGLQCGQGRKAPEEYNQQYKKQKNPLNLINERNL